jgi:hypothetical protein
MSMMEPFLPHPTTDDTIAAADPGVGAPAPAPGFGIEGEDPDVAEGQPDDARSPVDLTRGDVGGAAVAQDPPFRTPDPAEVRRPGAGSAE